ncbi:hypothetical protein C8J56DRAFT_144275 [Mycena floridula]|nr:hypothetical protein C8J56DRAFT_144275 [Mycena floridula]
MGCGVSNPRRRILLRDIAMRLDEFKSAKQLHMVILDALICHQRAMEQHQILHRDVNDGNILIEPEGTGLLVDWELVRPLDVKPEGNLKGTRQYMSVGLLAEPSKVHEVADDLESFVHVQMHHALCYIASSLDKWAVHKLVSEVYDEFKVDPRTGEVVGGASKQLFMIDPHQRLLPSQFKFTDCQALTHWFIWAVKLTGARISALAALRAPKVEDDSGDYHDENSDADDELLLPAPATVTVPLYNHGVLRRLWKRYANSSQWPTVEVPAKSQLPTSTEMKTKKRARGNDEEESLGGV